MPKSKLKKDILVKYRLKKEHCTYGCRKLKRNNHDKTYQKDKKQYIYNMIVVLFANIKVNKPLHMNFQI